MERYAPIEMFDARCIIGVVNGKRAIPDSLEHVKSNRGALAGPNR